MKLGENTYSVAANEDVIDVLDELNIHYSDEEEERISNKLMSELAFEAFLNIPAEGDTFEYLNMTITVLVMKQNRILRLKVQVNDPEKGEE